ncbi:Uncharacterised protein [Bifidobacterium longum subsp. infantis]|nr:Uncharacterised protein [Bifidobacterium longum subsp. infantis]
MSGDQGHRLGAGFVQCAHGFADSTGGIDHVVDDHAVAAVDIADNAMCLGMVRAGDITLFVDERQRQIA